MSNQIISELFLKLSDEQQEFLTGGTDFESISSNFTQKQVNKRGTSNSSPQGNTSNSTVQKSYISNSAQDSLGLDRNISTGISGLGSIPLIS